MPFEFEDLKFPKVKTQCVCKCQTIIGTQTPMTATFNGRIYLDILSSGFENIQENERSRPSQMCFSYAPDLLPGKEQNSMIGQGKCKLHNQSDLATDLESST